MLKPGERVTLIKEIARRLAPEEWSVIDLTLKQFSLPTSDQWGGGKFDYVVTMLGEVADEALLGLGSHVGFEITPGPSAIEPGFWDKGYFRLFIGHLADYREEAADLSFALRSYGISCFVAHTDIQPTKEWQDEIQLALSTADALVALLRPGFHDSYWTDQEIGHAMGRGLLVVPVKFEEDPYGFLWRFQAVKGAGKTPEELAAQLFEILSEHKQTRRRIAEGVVTRLVDSNTFKEAKANTALLERVRYFDDRLKARVEQAIDENSQIKDAFYVPERLRRFVAEWKQL